MPHDGTGTGWDVTLPANTEPARTGAQETRDLRKRVAIMNDKEHVAAGPSSAGGEHKAGSAKAYYQASAPTQRPDASTSLGSSDYGRIWVDSDDRRVYVYTAGGFLECVTGSFAAGSVNAAALATDAVETAKIKDLNVTLAKIATSTFTADATGRGKFAAGFVDSTLMASGAALANLASGSVPIAKLDSALNTLLQIRLKSGGFSGSDASDQTIDLGQVPHLILVVNRTTGLTYLCSAHTNECFDLKNGNAVSGVFSYTSGTTFTLVKNTVLNDAGKDFLYFALSNNA